MSPRALHSSNRHFSNPMSPAALVRLALVVFATITSAWGCTKITKPKADAPPVQPGSASVETFGDKLGTSELVPLSEAITNASQYTGRSIKVQGQVRRACSAKGCWMELAADKSPTSPSCRVTFKDYGFFVPTDSAGAEATIEGEIAVKRVKAGQVRHYEGEGATFPIKHEDGSADEVRFVATGVELRRH
jgi:Domain of unknown function (DUF4920)